ncbi:MAG: type II CAAX endopeptidase family protein [Desulfobacteraceae bacterium]|nr:type II CAAX endopeptidase family protein [Desulfobacteraceae bacterium]
MAPNPLKINTLTLGAILAAVVVTEITLGRLFAWQPLPHYTKVGLIRLVQILVIIGLLMGLEGGLKTLGFSPAGWGAGLKKGAIWSLGFGAAAGLAMTIIHYSGHNPLHWLRSPLPARPREVAMLFVVGGLIAPVAEELFFRGILYTYCRRWGVTAALLVTTAIFVLLHFHRIPVTQVVGGIVFALAYEFSHNLMTPITIHALGNLALFTLSLPLFQH